MKIITTFERRPIYVLVTSTENDNTVIRKQNTNLQV